MTGKRSYGDGCAVAHALDLVGERWALLILRELLFGPRRFSDLRSGLPTASANVLSQRLKELEAHAVVVRRKLPPPAASVVYELSEWGRELEPALRALGRWGRRSPFRDRTTPTSPDALMLALEGHFDSAAGQDLDATYGFRFGQEGFRARVAGGRLTVTRADPAGADAVIETDAEVFAEVLGRVRNVDEAVRDGDLRVTGDVDGLRRLFGTLTSVTPASVPAGAEPAPAG
jgi:DNA-binding HxlR family transcriptional regulator